MTNQELNRDIKRLNNAIKQAPKHTAIEQDFHQEFTRLYYADSSFESMNRESILIMLRLNLRHRFIALHSFGLNIKI